MNFPTLLSLTAILVGGFWLPLTRAAEPEKAAVARNPAPQQPVDLEYIDTSFENASPLWYDFAEDGTIGLHLLYDQERNSPNRAAGHIHFLIHAKTGAKLTFEFLNLENVYNGLANAMTKDLLVVCVSQNGKDWKPVPTEIVQENRVRLTVEMPGPRLYVAHVEPYRLSDLDHLLTSVRAHPLVQITPIGETVQGRTLEIVRVGSETAPYRVFIRARAHPWEPGGNWVVQGLVQRLLKGDAEAQKFLQRYCLYVMPMANKDGVARGGSRFNMQGKDLNRNWDKPADPALAPENACLEKWLAGMLAAGRKPHLALELHNDGHGQLHITHRELTRYVEHMAVLEKLLRKHTWFTEGSTQPSWRGSGTLADGMLERFGIEGAVHEFNCNWVAGLKDYPSGKHWEEYGAGLATVLYEYFGEVKP